jgi:hypothetical protein
MRRTGRITRRLPRHRGAHDVEHARNRSGEHRLELRELDALLAVAAPGGMVHHHRDRRVRQRELARERRFRHPGHADEVCAVALHARDLGGALQPRPLRRAVGAAVEHALAGAFRRIEDAPAQRRRIRLGEVDMRDRRAGPLEEGARPAPGVVDDLVGYDDRRGAELAADPADGRDRDHALGAGVPERPQVGAVVDLVRRQAVRIAVARQKHHGASVELPRGERRRGLAVGRARAAPLDVREHLEPGQAAAADDCKHHIPLMARISGRLRQ